MTNEFEKSFHPPASSSAEQTPELSFRDGSDLVERLGLPQTPELVEASEAIIAGLRDLTTAEPKLRAAWVEYARIVEAMVEAVDPDNTQLEAYRRAQISALINKALVFRTVDNMTRYLEELDHAEEYAFNAKLDDVRALIGDEIDRTLPSLEMSSEVLVLKLRGVISDDNREHLRDLINNGDDYEDIVNNAYNMIEDEGGDADEVLGKLGVLE